MPERRGAPQEEAAKKQAAFEAAENEDDVRRPGKKTYKDVRGLYERSVEHLAPQDEEELQRDIREDSETVNLTRAELREMLELAIDRSDFRGANFSYASFGDKAFRHPNFSEARLYRTTFEGCDLEGANFQNADLRKADFTHTNLKESLFDGATVGGADFRGARGLAATQKEDLKSRGAIVDEEATPDDEREARKAEVLQAIEEVIIALDKIPNDIDHDPRFSHLRDRDLRSEMRRLRKAVREKVDMDLD